MKLKMFLFRIGNPGQHFCKHPQVMWWNAFCKACPAFAPLPQMCWKLLSWVQQGGDTCCTQPLGGGVKESYRSSLPVCEVEINNKYKVTFHYKCLQGVNCTVRILVWAAPLFPWYCQRQISTFLPSQSLAIVVSMSQFCYCSLITLPPPHLPTVAHVPHHLHGLLQMLTSRGVN